MGLINFSRAIAAFALITATLGATPVIVNASFEIPETASGGLEYVPVGGTPWVFAGAGIGGAGGGGFFIPSPPPHGDQAAFLQMNNSSISQVVSGFTTGNVYTMSFYLAKRTDGCPPCGSTIGDLSISAIVNGNIVFAPVNVGTLSAGFHAFTSSTFVATAATMNISFTGSATPDQDSSAFLDQVTITEEVPEPGTMALSGAALLSVWAILRRRQNSGA